MQCGWRSKEMLVKGSFCFHLSWLSLGSKFIFPETLAKPSSEKEAENVKDNNKILPGLKWLKLERFFHFPHCHRFQPVYPGKNTEREGSSLTGDWPLISRDFLFLWGKNNNTLTTVHQYGTNVPHHPESHLLLFSFVSHLLHRISVEIHWGNRCISFWKN